jgi:hypothetical protein
MALERLVAMCPKELSPTLAFHMLRAGIQEERAALGFADACENIFAELSC